MTEYEWMMTFDEYDSRFGIQDGFSGTLDTTMESAPSRITRILHDEVQKYQNEFLKRNRVQVNDIYILKGFGSGISFNKHFLFVDAKEYQMRVNKKTSLDHPIIIRITEVNASYPSFHLHLSRYIRFITDKRIYERLTDNEIFQNFQEFLFNQGIHNSCITFPFEYSYRYEHNQEGLYTSFRDIHIEDFVKLDSKEGYVYFKKWCEIIEIDKKVEKLNNASTDLTQFRNNIITDNKNT